MWERGQGGVGCGEQEVTDLHIGASAGQHPFHDLNALHRQGWCAGAVKAAMRGEGGHARGRRRLLQQRRRPVACQLVSDAHLLCHGVPGSGQTVVHCEKRRRVMVLSGGCGRA